MRAYEAADLDELGSALSWALFEFYRKLDAALSDDPEQIDSKNDDEMDALVAFLEGARHRLVHSDALSVFRYRSPNEFALAELESGQIYFANVRRQNDPAEYNLVSRPIPRLEKYFEIAEGALWDHLQESTSSEIEKNVLARSYMSDQHRLQEERLLQEVAKVYIACFSSSPAIAPMWAHYASQHSGICIEYDLRSSPAMSVQDLMLWPVRYDDTPLNVWDCLTYVLWSSRLSPSFCETIPSPEHLPALHKSKQWSYEKEFRLLASSSSGEPGLLRGEFKINKVYLGIAVDNSFKQTVIDISQRNGYEVEEASRFLFPEWVEDWRALDWLDFPHLRKRPGFPGYSEGGES